MISLSGLALVTALTVLVLGMSGCRQTMTEYEVLFAQSTLQARPIQIVGKWFSKGSSHGPYEAGTDTILEIRADGTGELRYQRRPLPANLEPEYDVYPFTWAYKGNGYWVFGQKSSVSAGYIKGSFRFSQGYLLRETQTVSATGQTAFNRQIFVPANKLRAPQPRTP